MMYRAVYRAEYIGHRAEGMAHSVKVKKVRDGGKTEIENRQPNK